MPEKRFVIGPYVSGLMQNMPPWELPDDAFTRLNNAYVFRNRVRRRIGARLLNTPEGGEEFQHFKSRLREQIGTTDPGTGNASITLDPALYGTFLVGAGFSIGSVYYTVPALGTPVDLLVSSGGSTGTFNTTTGQLTITGAVLNTAIYYYPAKPVMGLSQFYANIASGEPVAINDQPTVAFDTRRAYHYTSTGWQVMGTNAATQFWHGNETDFFWTCNYRGSFNQKVLFATNFNVVRYGPAGANDDPIMYWAPPQSPNVWIDYTPYTAPNNAPPTPTTASRIVGARIIVQWQGRLLLLNTVETVDINPGGPPNFVNRPFPNRVRFSAIGNPLNDNAFYETGTSDGTLTSVGGGVKQAATEEEIVSVGFIKNRLIVYFEQSTWELIYTGNQLAPFDWQKLTAELGSQSTFSTISFDNGLLAVGNTGIHSCSGTAVARIDQKIPQIIFKIDDKTSGIRRVQGVRDFYNELAYWTLPQLEGDRNLSDYPNRMLVYNYANQSWAFNDDTITALGYFEQSSDLTWEQMTFPWQETSFSWTAGLQQANYRAIIAGNQHGFTFELLTTLNRNSPALIIAQVVVNSPTSVTLTVPRHNMVPGEVIAIEYALGITNLNLNFVIQSVTVDTITIISSDPVNLPFSGSYVGNGQITRVSRIDIQSKPWNPFVAEDINVAVNKLQAAVVKTSRGEITMDYFVSNSLQSMGADSVASRSAWGQQILETYPYALYPFEKTQSLLWHMYYPQASGSNFMLRMYLSDEQLLNRAIAWSYFELQAMVLMMRSAGSPLE